MLRSPRRDRGYLKASMERCHSERDRGGDGARSSSGADRDRTRVDRGFIGRSWIAIDNLSLGIRADLDAREMIRPRVFAMVFAFSRLAVLPGAACSRQTAAAQRGWSPAARAPSAAGAAADRRRAVRRDRRGGGRSAIEAGAGWLLARRWRRSG
jgi:hypothetical protein